MESFIAFIDALPPLWVYGALFAFAYIENLFPPSPSDLIIVFGGSLVGFHRIDFLPALLSATAGSTLGFVTMYKIGDWFGLKVVERQKLRFIRLESIHKVEAWFRKYGYWVIVANRFLSGTRAVVSFFAGLSELKLGPTTMLSLVSALAWNVLLLYSGSLVGANWKSIGLYLETYSRAVFVVILVVIALVVLWHVLRRKREA